MWQPRRAPAVAGMLAVLLVTACSGGGPTAGETAHETVATGGGAAPPATTTPGAPATTAGTTTGPGSGQRTTGHDRRPVTIAFAGDVHFEAFLAPRLSHPSTALGPMADVLRSADLSIVNLETAVTTRGAPQPKEFTFRAPPAAFDAVRAAGVDVVTMANNHALDYGPIGVPDALAAARARHLPVIGIGQDAGQAYAPWVATIHGQRIAFLAASAFLVPRTLVPSWSAGPDHPGLAMAMPGHGARLVAAVRAVRPTVDTVVVDLHWGSDDLRTCPTPWQRRLAADLTEAGADIVVGQHTHVLQGAGYRESSYVDYGLGNFLFYVPDGGATARSGILTLTVQGRRVSDPRWAPAELVGGVPQPVTGPEATTARQQWSGLRACTGLAARPRG